MRFFRRGLRAEMTFLPVFLAIFDYRLLHENRKELEIARFFYHNKPTISKP
jgi:hypothetical protein